jgi:nitrogen regulatory protein PII
MQTHPKKRIDIIIEMPLLRRITERFDKAGVSGYSVLPVIAGRGQTGAWSAGGQVSEVGQMAAIICIVDAGKADAVLDEVFAVVKKQIGFVTVSDVAVVRPERF